MNPQEIARLALSVVVVMGFGVVLLGWMIWTPTETSSVGVLAGLTGSLGTGYVQVLSYWFSKASDKPQ